MVPSRESLCLSAPLRHWVQNGNYEQQLPMSGFKFIPRPYTCFCNLAKQWSKRTSQRRCCMLHAALANSDSSCVPQVVCIPYFTILLVGEEYTVSLSSLLAIASFLVCFLFLRLKTMNKSCLGRISYRRVRSGTQGRNMEAAPEAEAIEEHWLLVCSVCFLIHLKPTCLGNCTAMVGQLLLHQSAIKETFTDQSNGGISSFLFPPVSSWQPTLAIASALPACQWESCLLVSGIHLTLFSEPGYKVGLATAALQWSTHF